MALEQIYTLTQDPSTYLSLQTALKEVMLFCTSTTKTQILHQSQNVLDCQFGWQRNSLSLATDGEVLTDPHVTNDSFAFYYRGIYSIRVTYAEHLLGYLAPVYLS